MSATEQKPKFCGACGESVTTFCRGRNCLDDCPTFPPERIYCRCGHEIHPGLPCDEYAALAGKPPSPNRSNP